MKMRLTIAVLAAFVPSTAAAQPRDSMGNEPVTLSASATDPCSYGAIVDQGPEGAVGVYPGASNELEIQDYVAGGTAVWVCETSNDGEMVGIIYANFPDMDCEVSSPVREDTDYFGPCESGWVMAADVELLAG